MATITTTEGDVITTITAVVEAKDVTILIVIKTIIVDMTEIEEMKLTSKVMEKMPQEDITTQSPNIAMAKNTRRAI